MVQDQPFVARDFLGLGLPLVDRHHDSPHSLPIASPPFFRSNMPFEGGKQHDMWTKVSIKQHVLPHRNRNEDKFVEQSAENVPEGSIPLTLQTNFGNFAYPASVEGSATQGINMLGGALLESRMHPSGSKGKEGCAPLTIFYGGTVNVYNNITMEKAHAIMRFAALHANSTNVTSNPFVINTADTIPDAQPCASAPSLLSEYQQSVVPGALPQARKASLTRFLEKRRERLQSKSPYMMKQDDSHFPEERFSSSNDVFTS